MIKLIFVAVLIFFMLWLSVNINRSYRKDRQTKEAFLDREKHRQTQQENSLLMNLIRSQFHWTNYLFVMKITMIFLNMKTK